MPSSYTVTTAVVSRGVALAYTFAFASLFVQLPALYGHAGLLPVDGMLSQQRGQSTPALHRLVPMALGLGIHVDIWMDALCILGMSIAVTAVWRPLAPLFAILWLLYHSMFHIGQTFMSFQWDILLLEVGVVAVFLSPLLPSREVGPAPVAALAWMRVVLFKLMFMSGVVKLQSGCPTWLGLTATQYHYATQCIPTPFAWWAHQMPTVAHKFSVALTLLFQIVASFFLLVPLRGARVVGAALHIVLQTLILLTGNYNFFNFLGIVMCIAALDDSLCRPFLIGLRLLPKKAESRTTVSKRSSSFCTAVLSLVCCGTLLVLFNATFGVQFEGKWPSDVNLKMSLDQLNDYVGGQALPTAACMAILVTAGYSARNLVGIFSAKEGLPPVSGAVNRLFQLAGILAAIFFVFANLEPLADLDRTGSFARFSQSVAHRAYPRLNIVSLGSTAFNEIRDYHFVSGYGLFRRMTGVGKGKDGKDVVVERPEVVLKGSASADGKGPWREYEFRFKPGNVTRSPPWVAPHQPRVDWQMWFAALGDYRQNPWLVHLACRLLSASEGAPVLSLFEDNPFSESPPALIKADLYHYDFTSWNNSGAQPKAWWHRRRVREYLQPLSLPVCEQVKQWFGTTSTPVPPEQLWARVVVRIREYQVYTGPAVVAVLFAMVGARWLNIALEHPV